MLTRSSAGLALTGWVVGIGLLLAQPVEAGQKRAREKNHRVVRHDAERNRKVVLQRKVTRQAGEPNRQVFEKTVVRRKPAAQGQRVIKLEKKVVHLGGEQASVTFEKTVERKPGPKPQATRYTGRHHDVGRGYHHHGRHHHHGVSVNVHYDRGSRPACNSRSAASCGKGGRNGRNR